GTASFIAAGVLAILAVLALLLFRRNPAVSDEGEAAGQPRTLQEALAAAPDETALAAAAVAAATGAAVTEGAVEAMPVQARTPVALQVDPGIFRAYDVRGVVGKALDIDVARLLGQAVGTVMHE